MKLSKVFSLITAATVLGTSNLSAQTSAQPTTEETVDFAVQMALPRFFGAETSIKTYFFGVSEPQAFTRFQNKDGQEFMLKGKDKNNNGLFEISEVQTVSDGAKSYQIIESGKNDGSAFRAILKAFE